MTSSKGDCDVKGTFENPQTSSQTKLTEFSDDNAVHVPFGSVNYVLDSLIPSDFTGESSTCGDNLKTHTANETSDLLLGGDVDLLSGIENTNAQGDRAVADVTTQRESGSLSVSLLDFETVEEVNRSDASGALLFPGFDEIPAVNLLTTNDGMKDNEIKVNSTNVDLLELFGTPSTADTTMSASNISGNVTSQTGEWDSLGMFGALSSSSNLANDGKEVKVGEDEEGGYLIFTEQDMMNDKDDNNSKPVLIDENISKSLSSTESSNNIIDFHAVDILNQLHEDDESTKEQAEIERRNKELSSDFFVETMSKDGTGLDALEFSTTSPLFVMPTNTLLDFDQAVLEDRALQETSQQSTNGASLLDFAHETSVGEGGTSDNGLDGFMGESTTKVEHQSGETVDDVNSFNLLQSVLDLPVLSPNGICELAPNNEFLVNNQPTELENTANNDIIFQANNDLSILENGIYSAMSSVPVTTDVIEGSFHVAGTNEIKAVTVTELKNDTVAQQNRSTTELGFMGTTEDNNKCDLQSSNMGIFSANTSIETDSTHHIDTESTTEHLPGNQVDNVTDVSAEKNKMGSSVSHLCCQGEETDISTENVNLNNLNENSSLPKKNVTEVTESEFAETYFPMQDPADDPNYAVDDKVQVHIDNAIVLTEVGNDKTLPESVGEEVCATLNQILQIVDEKSETQFLVSETDEFISKNHEANVQSNNSSDGTELTQLKEDERSNEWQEAANSSTTSTEEEPHSFDNSAYICDNDLQSSIDVSPKPPSRRKRRDHKKTSTDSTESKISQMVDLTVDNGTGKDNAVNFDNNELLNYKSDENLFLPMDANIITEDLAVNSEFVDIPEKVSEDTKGIFGESVKEPQTFLSGNDDIFNLGIDDSKPVKEDISQTSLIVLSENDRSLVEPNHSISQPNASDAIIDLFSPTETAKTNSDDDDVGFSTVIPGSETDHQNESTPQLPPRKKMSSCEDASKLQMINSTTESLSEQCVELTTQNVKSDNLKNHDIDTSHTHISVVDVVEEMFTNQTSDDVMDPLLTEGKSPEFVNMDEGTVSASNQATTLVSDNSIPQTSTASSVKGQDVKVGQALHIKSEADLQCADQDQLNSLPQYTSDGDTALKANTLDIFSINTHHIDDGTKHIDTGISIASALGTSAIDFFVQREGADILELPQDANDDRPLSIPAEPYTEVTLIDTEISSAGDTSELFELPTGENVQFEESFSTPLLLGPVPAANVSERPGLISSGNEDIVCVSNMNVMTSDEEVITNDKAHVDAPQLPQAPPRGKRSKKGQTMQMAQNNDTELPSAIISAADPEVYQDINFAETTEHITAENADLLTTNAAPTYETMVNVQHEIASIDPPLDETSNFIYISKTNIDSNIVGVVEDFDKGSEPSEVTNPHQDPNYTTDNEDVGETAAFKPIITVETVTEDFIAYIDEASSVCIDTGTNDVCTAEGRLEDGILIPATMLDTGETAVDLDDKFSPFATISVTDTGSTCIENTQVSTASLKNAVDFEEDDAETKNTPSVNITSLISLDIQSSMTEPANTTSIDVAPSDGITSSSAELQKLESQESSIDVISDDDGSVFDSDNMNISDLNSSDDDLEAKANYDSISQVSLEFDDNPFTVNPPAPPPQATKPTRILPPFGWQENTGFPSYTSVPSTVFLDEDDIQYAELPSKPEQPDTHSRFISVPFSPRINLHTSSDEAKPFIEVDDDQTFVAFDIGWDEIQQYKPEFEVMPVIKEESEPEEENYNGQHDRDSDFSILETSPNVRGESGSSTQSYVQIEPEEDERSPTLPCNSDPLPEFQDSCVTSEAGDIHIVHQTQVQKDKVKIIPADSQDVVEENISQSEEPATVFVEKGKVPSDEKTDQGIMNDDKTQSVSSTDIQNANLPQMDETTKKNEQLIHDDSDGSWCIIDNSSESSTDEDDDNSSIDAVKSSLKHILENVDDSVNVGHFKKTMTDSPDKSLSEELQYVNKQNIQGSDLNVLSLESNGGEDVSADSSRLQKLNLDGTQSPVSSVSTSTESEDSSASTTSNVISLSDEFEKMEDDHESNIFITEATHEPKMGQIAVESTQTPVTDPTTKIDVIETSVLTEMPISKSDQSDILTTQPDECSDEGMFQQFKLDEKQTITDNSSSPCQEDDANLLDQSETSEELQTIAEEDQAEKPSESEFDDSTSNFIPETFEAETFNVDEVSDENHIIQTNVVEDETTTLCFNDMTVSTDVPLPATDEIYTHMPQDALPESNASNDDDAGSEAKLVMDFQEVLEDHINLTTNLEDRVDVFSQDEPLPTAVKSATEVIKSEPDVDLMFEDSLIDPSQEDDFCTEPTQTTLDDPFSTPDMNVDEAILPKNDLLLIDDMTQTVPSVSEEIAPSQQPDVFDQSPTIMPLNDVDHTSPITKKKLVLELDTPDTLEDEDEIITRKEDRTRHDTIGSIDLLTDSEEELDSMFTPSKSEESGIGVLISLGESENAESLPPLPDSQTPIPGSGKRRSIAPPSSLVLSVALDEIAVQTPADELAEVKEEIDEEVTSANDVTQKSDNPQREGNEQPTAVEKSKALPDESLKPNEISIPQLIPPPDLKETISWETIVIGNIDYKIDGSSIQAYKRVISHGGFYKEKSTIVEIFGQYLPENSIKNYAWVADNLFLYLLSTLELLVQDKEYVIVFFNNSVLKSHFPSTAWLKKCHSQVPELLRKKLKGFYVVQSSFYMKTLINFTRMFISRKAFKKIKHVKNHSELKQYIPIDFLFVPEDITGKLIHSYNSQGRKVKPKWKWW